MAGDPDLATTRALLSRCVALGITMVELCVPFRNAFTDGDTLRRSHARALENETSAAETLSRVLDLVRDFSTQIYIVLLVDSSHSLRPVGIDAVLEQAVTAGVAAVLPHGLPPRLGPVFHRAAERAGMPVVGTVYSNALPDVRRQVLSRSSAFLYLVSTYGRSGGAVDPEDLKTQITALRSHSTLPIALGFGLRTADDVARAFAAGSDIAIVGSAIAAKVEAALSAGQCPVKGAEEFISELQAAAAMPVVDRPKSHPAEEKPT
jgi:tryptophan synthase alpha chain